MQALNSTSDLALDRAWQKPKQPKEQLSNMCHTMHTGGKATLKDRVRLAFAHS